MQRMRWLFLLATIPACLWIPSTEHDERKRSLDPEFILLDLTPDRWSVCAGPPAFTAVGQVAERHAGRMFETWFEVDGERSGSGPATAGENGGLLFGVSPGELAPGCADTCPVTFTVGVSHLGFSDQVDVEVTILGETQPSVAQAALVGADGSLHDLSTLLPDDNPRQSLQQERWPTLAIGLVDPYLSVPGRDFGVQVMLCPQGVDPSAGGADCVVEEAVDSPHALSGDAVYEVSTASFAAAACADGQRGLSWDPYVVLAGHPCPSSGLVALDTPLRLVLPDCDADSYTVADGDCDDDDPTRHPGATEVWYDGIDQNCDGADDFDRDGDGVHGGPNGLDCDDNDASTYPGAPEICDGRDNDCDGYQLVDVVTIETGVDVLQYATLEQALTAASAGDTVRVCPGEFTGAFVIDKDLTVIGSGRDRTVLKPSLPGRPVVDIVGGITLRLEGVEITGATDTTGTLRGGGLRAAGVADLSVISARIVGNEAHEGGGLLLGGRTLLQDVIVSGNEARAGGGIYVDRGVRVTVEGTDISGNTAVEGGGVVLTDDASYRMDAASRIRANTAVLGGGLLMLDDCVLVGGEVTANVAVDGGGVYARAERDTVPVPYLESVRIADHVDPGLQRGGAIFATGEGMELLMYDCVLEDNTVSNDGGAISVGSSGTYAALVWFEQTEIRNNIAGADGGGVHVENTYIYAYDSTVAGNRADRGGGFFGDTFVGELSIELSNNVALSDGGGVYAYYGVIYNLYDQILLVGNSAVQGGGAYLDDSWLVSPDAVVTGNTATGRGGGFFVTNNAHAGLWGSGAVNGNGSQNNETNGVWVGGTADSFVSCPTMSNSDTVGCSTTPAAGVPSNNCFTVYPTGLADGQCDECP